MFIGHVLLCNIILSKKENIVKCKDSGESTNWREDSIELNRIEDKIEQS